MSDTDDQPDDSEGLRELRARLFGEQQQDTPEPEPATGNRGQSEGTNPTIPPDSRRAGLGGVPPPARLGRQRGDRRTQPRHRQLTGDTTMSNIALSTARQHLKALDLEMPQALTDALAAVEADLGDRTPLRFDRAALTEAVANCLSAGRNPLTDKTVREHLTAAQLNGLRITEALDGLTEQRRAAVVTEHAPAILDLLGPVVAGADAALTEAREKIPGLDLQDVRSVSALRPALMQVWGRAREAAEAVQHAEVVWTTLARECHLVRVPDGMGALIFADLTLEDLEALPRANSTARPNAASVVKVGHRLDLATPEEFIGRCQRMSEAREQREARRERELQAAGFDHNRRNAVA